MNTGTRPLTSTEIEVIKLTLGKNVGTIRDRTLFILGIKTGFRISEILSIKVLDCLQYGKVKPRITVSKGNTKGKIASRSVVIGEELSSVLTEYISSLPEGQEWLFTSRNGSQLSRSQAWRMLRQAFELNQFEGKVATHSMRKSLATKVYEKSGKDIVATQRALGHKNINSTISYLKFTDEQLDSLFLSID